MFHGVRRTADVSILQRDTKSTMPEVIWLFMSIRVAHKIIFKVGSVSLVTLKERTSVFLADHTKT
jgi:hypothetical protein